MALSRRQVRPFIACLLWMRHLRARRKRAYVREVLRDRRTESEFVTLVIKKLRKPGCAKDHFDYFRMSKTRFDDLLDRVKMKIIHVPNHRTPISPMERLAVTIHFLAEGGPLASLAYSYRLGMATLRNILIETTRAIWDLLKDEYVSPPSRQRWEEISSEFWNQWQFPLCIGAIDGKHIAIRCPPKSGSLYFNYKKFFSIVLLAIADANYKFVYVDIGGYGKEGDAALFHRAGLSSRLQNATKSYEEGGFNLPRDNVIPGTRLTCPHVLLGDDAFPLMRHLMKPYSYHTTRGDENVFNYRLSRARRVSENAFGILTARWRVLDSKMNLEPKLATDVVKACVALHNYMKSTDAVDQSEPTYVPANYVDYENENGEIVLGAWRLDVDDHLYSQDPDAGGAGTRRANYAVREKLKTFFVSEQGALPWQQVAVRRGDY